MRLNPEIIEATKRFEAQAGQASSGSTNSITTYIGSAMGLLIAFAYPITVLILMMLPAVKNGLAGKVDPEWQPSPNAWEGKTDSDETIRQ